MKNIFKGAVFADRFRTRDGRRALYLYGTTCWVDGNEFETAYSPDGSFGYRNGIGNLEIRVDDLDRISTDWINSNNFWTYLEKISKDPKRYHVYIEL